MTDVTKWLALIGGVGMMIAVLNGLRTRWLYHCTNAFSPTRKVYRDDEPFLYWINFVTRIVAGGALALVGIILLLT